ncbi:hypothetical protein CCMA1212_005128, partial [Trichoderma ghanense]
YTHLLRHDSPAPLLITPSQVCCCCTPASTSTNSHLKSATIFPCGLILRVPSAKLTCRRRNLAALARMRKSRMRIASWGATPQRGFDIAILGDPFDAVCLGRALGQRESELRVNARHTATAYTPVESFTPTKLSRHHLNQLFGKAETRSANGPESSTAPTPHGRSSTTAQRSKPWIKLTEPTKHPDKSTLPRIVTLEAIARRLCLRCGRRISDGGQCRLFTLTAISIPGIRKFKVITQRHSLTETESVSGTAALIPALLLMFSILRLLRQPALQMPILAGLRALNVIGGDMVKMSLAYDDNGKTTALAAVEVVQAILELMVAKPVEAPVDR